MQFTQGRWIKSIRSSLYPLSLLYKVATSLRNWLYIREILPSFKVGFRVLSVGNLSVGGTGKTPFVEYLVNNLPANRGQLAVLSRGYGRGTSGFYEVVTPDSPQQFGDEPSQLKRRFGDLKIFVCEDRVLGARKIAQLYPELTTLILDDGFQHQRIGRDLDILLTTYDDPFFNDFLLPRGGLREGRSHASRADLIVVTRAPKNISTSEKDFFINQIQTYAPRKPILFSFLRYAEPRSIRIEHQWHNLPFIFLSSIANISPIKTHLATWQQDIFYITLEDHASYSESLIRTIIAKTNNQKISTILTTTKDEVKLLPFLAFFLEANISLFVLDVSHQFMTEDEAAFFHTFVS